MADFFDVVIKDVELYGAGAETSEPVSAVNANRRVATANANNDSLVDSLTVWSRTHTDVQHPTDRFDIPDVDEFSHDAQVDTALHGPVDEGAAWIGQQVDRALQEAHFVNSRNLTSHCRGNPVFLQQFLEAMKIFWHPIWLHVLCLLTLRMHSQLSQVLML